MQILLLEGKRLIMRNMREKNGWTLLLDALKVVGISRRDRIPNCQSIFQHGPD
jgi:hypothetical protein